MGAIITEIIVIFMLLLANGFFAMTEIAVVSARKGRLRHLAAQGNSRARIALELAESPNRFLATVQIGITMVGIVAGAFGGATIAEKIRGGLQSVPLLAPYGEAIGLTIVVLVITYCSLVVGELVPKRFGLANPEGIAMAVAKPMRGLAVVAGPLVRFLGVSTEGLLRVLGFSAGKEQAVSEEEVKVLMQEGLRAGAFNRVESEIVHRALDLDQLTARDIMTPRPKIIWVSREDAHAVVWHKIVASGHSFFPVYEGNRDHVVGIVSVKAIYANLAAGTAANIRDLMTKPLVVPVTHNAAQLLETFKASGKHLALVSDEFGSIVGLVTLHNIMEAIVGELTTPEERARPGAKRRDDGSWLIDGMMEIERVESVLPEFRSSKEESKDYQTLAGFTVKQLGHVPK